MSNLIPMSKDDYTVLVEPGSEGHKKVINLGFEPVKTDADERKAAKEAAKAAKEAEKKASEGVNKDNGAA